jgi:hypothetical protein
MSKPVAAGFRVIEVDLFLWSIQEPGNSSVCSVALIQAQRLPFAALKVTQFSILLV